MNDTFKAILFVLLVFAVFCGALGYVVHHDILQAHDISIIGFAAFGTIVVLFAGAVLYQVGNNTIPLAGLISEPDDGLKRGDVPKASLSRFQFLIFTFVVAGLFLMLSIESGRLVDIPTNVLVLIGLSGTGFLAGKSLSAQPRATPSQADAEPDATPKKTPEPKDEA